MAAKNPSPDKKTKIEEYKKQLAQSSLRQADRLKIALKIINRLKKKT